MGKRKWLEINIFKMIYFKEKNIADVCQSGMLA